MRHRHVVRRFHALNAVNGGLQHILNPRLQSELGEGAPLASPQKLDENSSVFEFHELYIALVEGEHWSHLLENFFNFFFN